MPDDENNFVRSSLGEGECPTCPPSRNTVIPSVSSDSPPGTIPDEHVAILQANAARPEVKARFAETMTRRPIGSAREGAPAFVSVKAPTELPGIASKTALLDSTPFFAEQMTRPTLRSPSESAVIFARPAQLVGRATYISLHAYADLPDVGPPQFILDMTHPAAGIADAGTRAALSSLPLFRPATGTLYVTNEGCEASVEYVWDEDEPEPDGREIDAVKKFVEENAESLRRGDIIEVTLMPEGVVVYWEWIGGVAIPPACQRLERIKRHSLSKPHRLVVDIARRAGRIHKITAKDPELELPEGVLDDEEDTPPAEVGEPSTLPQPERPRPPSVGGGLGSRPLRFPPARLELVRRVSDEEAEDFDPVPESSPCEEQVFAVASLPTERIVVARVTKKHPVRQAQEPAADQMAALFADEKAALETQFRSNPDAFTGKLGTQDGLQEWCEGQATCNKPRCPKVDRLQVIGWSIALSDPKFTASYKAEAFRPGEGGGRWWVTATFEITAVATGTVWFSYWCVES